MRALDAIPKHCRNLGKVHDVRSRLAPRGVRLSVLAGLCAWFVLDSAGSIASGNASNALINILVLVLAAGPLWVPASDESPSHHSEEFRP